MRSRVLDYGCGLGAFAHSLAEQGNEVVGIDLLAEYIKAARECWAHSNLSFFQKNIRDLDASDFDLVVSQQVAEHTHNPGTYLAEINRVLRIGGKLLISLPNTANPRFFFDPVILSRKRYEKKLILLSQAMRREYKKETHHIQAWDQQHFVRFVSTLGFSLEAYRPLEGVPLPWLFKKFFRLPAYIKLPGRFSNWCYTMAFVFEKQQDVNLDPND